jgi:hypothetical protein
MLSSMVDRVAHGVAPALVLRIGRGSREFLTPAQRPSGGEAAGATGRRGRPRSGNRGGDSRVPCASMRAPGIGRPWTTAVHGVAMTPDQAPQQAPRLLAPWTPAAQVAAKPRAVSPAAKAAPREAWLA